MFTLHLVSNLVIIGWGNGLVQNKHQTITLTNDDMSANKTIMYKLASVQLQSTSWYFHHDNHLQNDTYKILAISLQRQWMTG